MPVLLVLAICFLLVGYPVTALIFFGLWLLCEDY